MNNKITSDKCNNTNNSKYWKKMKIAFLAWLHIEIINVNISLTWKSKMIYATQRKLYYLV